MLGRIIRRENSHLLVLLVYAAGYVLFPPRVLVINDEERYVIQAMAFARGDLTLPGTNSLIVSDQKRVASDYPPGTSLLQAPLVRLGGWPAAGLLSVLGLAALTIFTALLLRAYDLRQEFALAVLAFAGSLFFGRIAMSDVPNAAVVALALSLLVSSDDQNRAHSFLAGLSAGATLLFREPTAVLLAPFVVGAVVRRRSVADALLFGVATAIGIRLIVSHAMFGNAFFLRESGYRFSLASGWMNLPVYSLVLLVMFPFGAVLPFLYRGPRRQETLIAFVLYTLLFLFYDYQPWRENGPPKGTVLASRYVIPLLPLLAVTAADVFARWRQGAVRPSRRARRALFLAGIAALSMGSFAIHPLFRRLESEPHEIVTALRTHAARQLPVVMNEKAAGKYLSPVYGPRLLIYRSAATPETLSRICRERGGLRVVLLDRLDSEMFRQDSFENAKFLTDIERHLDLRGLYDQVHGAMRLRILAVGCGAKAPT